MNERIKQLAEQAGGHFGDGLEFAVVFGELDDFKKFAELIVRECVEIADEYDGVGSTIVSRIKKHFGVEL
jgi:GGDEF domain-containing protein